MNISLQTDAQEIAKSLLVPTIFLRIDNTRASLSIQSDSKVLSNITFQIVHPTKSYTYAIVKVDINVIYVTDLHFKSGTHPSTLLLIELLGEGNLVY